jgi:glycosyltransferase involved in cell wall biosynthesis
MMANPKVSILMTTWNRPQFLGQAIESIRAQTLESWELIVADDGSTDNTKQVVAEWMRKDRRIKYMNPGHLGRIAKISNIGLREAKGEYVAILDDDDWWVDSKKLEKQVAFLDKNRDYAGCGGGYLVIDKEGNTTAKVLKPEHDDDIRKVMLFANSMANSSTLFRRSIAEKLGYYDETMLQFADWDFWLKIGLEGKLYNFPEYFLAYRMWGGGMSFSKQKECASSGMRIVERYKNKYPGYWFALCAACAYATYAYFPDSIKQFLNPLLSRLKKALFSR